MKRVAECKPVSGHPGKLAKDSSQRSVSGHSGKLAKDSSQRSGFQVSPMGRFLGQCPLFRQPVEFGNFSLDGERKFRNDSRKLRHYVPPLSSHFKFDLRKGYDTCIQKDDDVKERLTHLLTWIDRNRKKFQLNDQEKPTEVKSLNTDFISWRGHFTKFLTTPYENRQPWMMAVTKFNGTIYISEVETEQGKQDRLNRPPRQQEMCYWGYKFEDYVTQPLSDTVESDTAEDIVNTNEAFCSVVRTRLNKHSILVGAEVDCCVRDKRDKPPANYIELKTTRMMHNHHQKQNFARYKLLKFWGQSFLAGVPKIIVGLRNDDGIVSQLQTFDTLNIPNIVKQHNKQWDASICMNFLDRLLTWLKEIIEIDDPRVVYMLSYEHPFQKISVKLIDDGSERFLPDWFVKDS